MHCHIHRCHYHHCNCVPKYSKENGKALTQEELLAYTQEMKQELKVYTVDLKDQIFSYIDIGLNPADIANTLASLEEQDTYILRTLTNTIDELNNTTNLSMFNLRARVTDLEGQIDELENNFSTLPIEGGVLADTIITVTPNKVGSIPRNLSDVLSERISVESFGAVGDGVAIDSDSLDAVIQAAGVGGMIVLSPSKTYKIMKGINLLEGQTLVGNGGTIKRIKQAHTLTTKAHTAGDKTFQVDSTEGFYVGMQVAFSKAGADRGSYNSTNYHYYIRHITSIDGNNITINASTGLELPTGSNIFTAFISVMTDKDCTVTGVTFDGNSSEWEFGGRWECVAEIRSNHPYNDPEPANLLITGNRFRNCPGEGVTVGGVNVVVSHNFFKDIQGNPMHMSGLENATIHHNFGINGNLDIKVGHQDGFIAYSNSSKNMVISENISVNCLRGVGPNNYTNGYSKVLNNTFLASRQEGILIAGIREHECIIDGNYIDGYGLSGAYIGISIGGSSKSITVVNNYIHGGGSEASEALVVRYATDFPSTQRVKIIGNTILGHCLITALDGAVISNNVFDLTSSTKKMVQIVGQSKGYDLYSCLVNGNVFKNAVVTSGSFGQAESVRASVKNLQISNNIFDASTLRPLSYAAIGSSVYIKNNTFNNITGSMKTINITAVDGAGSHVEVTGNSFDVVGDCTGVRVFSASSTHSVFNNNTVMSSAISLGSSHVVTISQGELNDTFIMNNIVKGNWSAANGFTLTSPAHVINNVIQGSIVDSTGSSVLTGNIEI